MLTFFKKNVGSQDSGSQCENQNVSKLIENNQNNRQSNISKKKSFLQSFIDSKNSKPQETEKNEKAHQILISTCPNETDYEISTPQQTSENKIDENNHSGFQISNDDLVNGKENPSSFKNNNLNENPPLFGNLSIVDDLKSRQNIQLENSEKPTDDVLKNEHNALLDKVIGNLKTKHTSDLSNSYDGVNDEDPELTLSDNEEELDFNKFYSNKKSLLKLNFSTDKHLIPCFEQQKKSQLSSSVPIKSLENNNKFEGLLDVFEFINTDKSPIQCEFLDQNNDLSEKNTYLDSECQLVINKQLKNSKDSNIPDENFRNNLLKVNEMLKKFDAQYEIEYDNYHKQMTFYSNEVSTDFINDMCDPKILIHSKFGKPPSFWLDLSSAVFSKLIFNNLSSLKVNSPLSSQKIVWPSVMRGLNTLLIGPKKSGKTLGFLIPLCSMLCDVNFKDLPDTKGPILWIICPSLITAIQIEKTCKILLKGMKNISVLRIDNSTNENEKFLALIEGCSVLISTPIVVKYVEDIDNVLSLKRLCFLMFCDTHILNNVFYKEIQQIFNTCLMLMEHRKNEEMYLQILADSTEHCDFLSLLATKLHNPLTAINAFQEGLVCSNADINAVFVHSNNKITEFENHLKNLNKNLKKIVIVCNSDEEISIIETVIDPDFYHIIKVFNHLNLSECMKIENEWRHTNRSKSTILISCDSGLINLNVTDADCLIHFSIPLLFSAFQFRFSTIISNLFPTWCENEKFLASTIIFIDETNHLQLPKLVNFLKRCGVELNDNISELAESLVQLKDIQKANSSISLCRELLDYGYCRDVWNCDDRHSVILKYDKLEDWLPQSGYINFKPICVNDVCHYSARLISYIKVDGTSVEVKQDYLNIALKISLHFSTEENKFPVGVLQPGKICVAELKVNQFVRCRILRVLNEGTLKIKVLVNLIDIANNIICDSDRLFELPETFHEPSNSIQVIVAGIMPNDKDISWSILHTNKVRDLFSKLGNKMFLRGKIMLGLNNTYWLDSVQCCEFLSASNKVIVRENVKNYIIDNEIGTLNPQHMYLLYNVCEKNSFDLPNYHLHKKPIITDNNKIKLPEPQWAFIEKEIFSEIYFSIGINPDTFFIRIVKWESCLNLLNKDIENYVEDINKNDTSLNNITYEINDYCLAKHSDDKFYRCRINKIECIDDLSVKYTCFFVDYGDFGCVEKHDLRPLSSKLITQLPFQAIECKLVGLKPISTEWSASAINFLQDFCFQSEFSDVLKVLCAKEMFSMKADFTNGNKSALFIFDPLNQENFNQIFITKKFADLLSSEFHYLSEGVKHMNDYITMFSKLNNEDDENYDVEMDSCNESHSSESKNSFIVVDHTNESNFNNEADNDESFYDDDWDVTFDLNHYNELMKMSGNHCKIVEVPQDVNTSNIDKYFESKSPIPQKIETFNPKKEEKPVNNDIKKLTPSPEKPSHKTPSVRWSQTDKQILIKIDLIGVDLYNLNIGIDTLVFDCLLKGVQYKLNMELFGCIQKEESFHSCLGLYIHIKLLKVWEKPWPTLLRTSLKTHWLKYDYDINNSDSEEEEIKKNELAKKEHIKKLLIKNDHEADSEEDEEDVPELAEILDYKLS